MAVIHGIVGTLIPLILIMMLTRFFGSRKSWSEGLNILPFALFAGLCFTLPYTMSRRTVRVGDKASDRISLFLTGTIDKPELDLGKLLQDQAIKKGVELLLDKLFE